jgi:hypothetical protein
VIDLKWSYQHVDTADERRSVLVPPLADVEIARPTH